MSTPTDRYVLAGLGEKAIAFPDYYVLDVLVVDRNYVMRLPFYSPSVVGVTQHLGKIVPLLSLRHLHFKEQNLLLPGQLPVVRLAKSLPELFGAGLIVDRVMGTLSHPDSHDLIPIDVILEQLSGSHWLPQRWYALN